METFRVKFGDANKPAQLETKSSQNSKPFLPLEAQFIPNFANTPFGVQPDITHYLRSKESGSSFQKYNLNTRNSIENSLL